MKRSPTGMAGALVVGMLTNRRYAPAYARR